MSKEERDNLRKELEMRLRKCPEGEKIKFNMSHEMLEELIFDRKKEFEGEERKVFAIDSDLIKKIDLTGVSFREVDIEDIDFAGTKGVEINPQTIYDKSLCGTRLTDTTIIGPLGDVNVMFADFTGSKGAEINPQTIYRKSLCGTKLRDVETEGSFYGANMIGTDFTGCISKESDYAQIHKEFVKKI